ncbi:MAG: succinylglutamate desuccinylase/aspartoacylase family protein [Silvanigrellales bacterium]|jgi:succinylglutamate desuccinylase|nr:succinylglutamate desuccinylase/aspartoacylase family protein [Silvanigrellales bacterium]
MNDINRVAREIEEFEAWGRKGSIGGRRIEQLGPYAFALHSKGEGHSDARKRREFDLGLVGIAHGNEVAGVSVLNEVLRRFDAGTFSAEASVMFALGDVPAALAGKRFLEADLNRSFGLAQPHAPAHHRARELERIFERTNFLIDFHQTQGPSSSPFYISRFDADSFLAFRALRPECPVVTYLESSFSTQGMTTLNYHLLKGGRGFGLELGEKGFWPNQIDFGVNLVADLLAAADFDAGTVSSTGGPGDDRDVFTFDETLKTQSGTFELRPGLSNLAWVEPGVVFGTIDGEPLAVKERRRVLFPKYLRSGESGIPGMEVVRLLKFVGTAELSAWMAQQQ